MAEEQKGVTKDGARERERSGERGEKKERQRERKVDRQGKSEEHKRETEWGAEGRGATGGGY